jgi:predicted RNA methylase
MVSHLVNTSSGQCTPETLPSPTDFDTVVMNPPFGTRNTGIDTAFVMKGMEYSNVVYSLHKTSTREVWMFLILLLQ